MTRRPMHRYLPILLVLALVSCVERAPNLTPAEVLTVQANEVVVALNTFQHAAIELNKVQDCDPLPCQLLLSDDNTEVVVDAVADALTSLRAVPAGWKATGLAAADRIELRLDAAGKTKLAGYLVAAKAVINAIIP